MSDAFHGEPSKRHLNAVFDNHSRARSIRDRLCSLASAFAATGNKVVAEKLFDIADEVMESAEIVRNSHGDMLSDQLKETQAATGNILVAMLAGIDMGVKSKG